MVICVIFFALTNQKVIDIYFDLFDLSAQFHLTFQPSDDNLQIADIFLWSPPTYRWHLLIYLKKKS